MKNFNATRLLNLLKNHKQGRPCNNSEENVKNSVKKYTVVRLGDAYIVEDESILLTR